MRPSTFALSLMISDPLLLRRAFTTVALIGAAMLVSFAAAGDTLVTQEFQITASTAYETQPILGNDGSTDLVVFTSRGVRPDGGFELGDIWYQRLDGGAPMGLPVQVTDSPAVHEQVNDTSGDWIVFRSDTGAPEGYTVELYRISTGERQSIGSAELITWICIAGDKIVWIESETGSYGLLRVMYFELAWLNSGFGASVLAGPLPPASQVQIGDRFVVWAEESAGQTDIVAYDLGTFAEIQVTSTPGITEGSPETAGDWIVWEAFDKNTFEGSIEACNLATLDCRRVKSSPPFVVHPTIHGDYITYESTAAGNSDIYLYRLSTGDTFQVTTESNDQYLCDVFGDYVAYVDRRYGSEDVYVSRLEIVPPNQPPVANAGVDQSAPGGASVTLDGTGSSDPDANYPLSYVWEFVARPPGSTAMLANPTSVSPSFSPDSLGDYRLRLIVTDSLGAESAPDEVLVSTFNTVPVADAGPDQAVTIIGTTVTLDGTQSYDDDGDAITYSWSFIEPLPPESQAVLDDPTSPTPSFVADVNATYSPGGRPWSYDALLVVTDVWGSWHADWLGVSFENVKPVANSGGNQAVAVGDTVALDGSGSSDANGDPLTYLWGMVDLPDGSSAEIVDPTAAQTSFVADIAGTYVVSLVVNDSLEDSEPSNMTVTATSTQSELIESLDEIVDVVNALDPGQFKNKNMAKALTNKFAAALALVDAGEYQAALDKLEHDVLGKTDGCAGGAAPDKNDWIKDCAGQAQLYPLISDTIALLELLI